MNYLVVDDSPTMRRVIINALAVIGFKDIYEAGNGSEALDVLDKKPIDFVITDWNMPVMNGLELIQSIRSNPDHSKLPILMVTTRGNKEDIIEALKAKVNNYVVKPFTPAVLKEKISTVMQAINK